ncbi:DHHW family protein [Ruminococcus flavefaciens]|uniref:DHHW protein n=1 Tax=Ruminococcus flavefaciens TaxID=1265 RepID=A0A1M7HUS1_RUMFL|nr:DHHW family protein [Ruminococcus flavefaciens]SHM32266.1 DHHW protein [Ruminococcus flavefaciens]
MNKLNRTMSIVTAVLSLSVISVLGLMSFLGEKKFWSSDENRQLTAFPEPSFNDMYNGSWAKQLDSYATDHFTDRSKWVYAKNRMQVELSESIVNGVYVGSERLLDTEVSGQDKKVFSDNISIINAFEKNYDGTTYFVAVPSSTGVYGDILPSNFISRSDSQRINELYEMLSNNIRRIDAYNILKMMKDNYIFYRNDTKWTSYGAYCVYKTVIQKLGFLPTSYDKYSIEHVSDSFRGDLYNRTLYDEVKADILDIYNYPEGADVVSCERILNDGSFSEGEIYDRSRLASSDMYSMYLGENVPLLRIKTSVQNDKRLLVIKDSYADCFIPFLIQHYSEITAVSPDQLDRPLGDIININDYSQTLFLFGINNMDEKMALEKITERI